MRRDGRRGSLERVRTLSDVSAGIACTKAVASGVARRVNESFMVIRSRVLEE